MKTSNWLNIALAVALAAVAVLYVRSQKDTPENEKAAATSALENIMTRASVRGYTAEPVTDAAVDTLLRAAMAAPTAADKRPWQFIVVRQQALRDSIAATQPYAEYASEAPVVIVACGNLDLALDGPAADYWVQDVSAASENLLLAAHATGLGAVWCGVYPIEERVADIRRILNLPANLIPLNVICIGHPAAPGHPQRQMEHGPNPPRSLPRLPHQIIASIPPTESRFKPGSNPCR